MAGPYGHGYNNPQMGPGYGYNNQQMAPGYGYNNPQMAPGYGYNNPQMAPGPGYGYNNQQMAPGYGYNNPPMAGGYGQNQAMMPNQAMPIQQQPRQRPPILNHTVEPIEGVLPGLEVLQGTEHLFVRQTVELMEFLYNAPNKYEVLDSMGRRIFFAIETTGICARNCCPNCATFHIKVVNFLGHEILHVEGTPGCCGCDATVKIFHGTTLLGDVSEMCACLTPKFQVKNAAGQLQFIIKGPEVGLCCMFGTAEFDVFLPDMTTNVGRISKKWSGLGQELFTEADNFGISFPANLPPELKAVLLGITFLIDFRFFENQDKGQGQAHAHVMV